MNLDVKNWGTFKVSDLFVVKYGVNLELNTCEETEDKDSSVNFVARTAENNGVSARVKNITGVVPQDKGLISVAGGGSVLSTFLQPEPFYSGRDLYTLESKVDISDEAKFFIITVIEQNKYKYSYGRQANKTLPDLLLKLPVNEQGKPDYKFMEQYVKRLHHKPLTTKNKSTKVPELNTATWKEFRFGSLIKNIYKSKSINKDDLQEVKEGENGIRYITRTGEDNGCELIASMTDIEQNNIEKGNALTIGDTTATCFYQGEDFITGEHIVVVRANWLNEYNALYVCTILGLEMYKYSYGREFLIDRIKETIIKLPIVLTDRGDPYFDKRCTYSKEGYVPDWQFMENYIKSLPYGDRI